MAYIVETKELSKAYNGKTVVNKVSMHIEKGSIYGFVGENGSGKTTIMRLLMDLAIPTGGTYSLFGASYGTSHISLSRKKISAIVETPSLVPSMTAMDNLVYACLYYGLTNYQPICKKALETVGLSKTGKKKVKNFSLGMRQRLGIAVLLLKKPELILLDEPMNGLDPEGIAELRNLIIELNKQGITFLISSHILSELEKVATHWGFINKGHLLKEMTAEELLDVDKPGIVVKYHDVTKLKEALKKHGYNDFREESPGVIKINTGVQPLTLLTELQKENIEIKHMHTVETSVEDFYLDLIKGRTK